MIFNGDVATIFIWPEDCLNMMHMICLHFLR